MKKYLKILTLPLLVPLFFVGAVYGSTAISHSGISGNLGINSTVNPPNLQSGLVGHWTFDGKDMTQNVADSVGNHTGSYVGATTTMAGILGQALAFNGTSNYFSAANATAFDLAQGAIAFWIKDSSDTVQTVADPYVGGGAGDLGLHLYVGGNVTGACTNELLTLYNSGIAVYCFQDATRTDLIDGKWHQVVVQSNGTNVSMYIDGVSKTVTVATGADGQWWQQTSPGVRFLNIGADGTPGNYLNGSLDDVRIYNRALSAAEVKQLYQSGQSLHPNTTVNPPNLQSGLVGHWTFDGKDLVSNATDSAGSNNGLLTGYSSATTTTAGPIGQSLIFNGTSQYVNAGTSAALQPSAPISMSAWINPTSFPVQGAIMGVTDSPDGQYTGYQMILGASGQIYLQIGCYNGVAPCDTHSSGTRRTCATANSVITLNKWNHVVGLIPSPVTGTYTVYVNGVAKTCTSDGSTGNAIAYAGTSTFRIGAFYDFSAGAVKWFFPGTIDDVRLYNRALSASEISQLYQLGR